MSLTPDEIMAEAMKLSPDERADLADRLWISAMPREEVAAAWDAEIARRVAEIDAGTAELIPSEDVFAWIDEELHKAGE